MRVFLVFIVFLLIFTGQAWCGPVVADSRPRDEEIRNAVAAYVQQRTSSLGCEARIRRLSFAGTTSVPGDNLQYEVVAPQQWEGWGSAGISIIIRDGDRVVRNIPARVEVEALVDMVVTVRQIDHGSVLVAEDLSLRRMDLAAVQGRYLPTLSEAVGKKARITLKANMPVRSDQLERVPVIKAGQIVTIIAENDRMRITVTGKAKNSGSVGDTITVQNLNSMKEIPARIIDAGTVAVVF